MTIYEMKIGVDKAMQFLEGFASGLGCENIPAQTAREVRAKMWKLLIDSAAMNGIEITDIVDEEQLSLKSVSGRSL